MYRIRFHGRGGQGMKTASRILGTAFFLEGFEVQDAPRYGAERRGAPIFAYVRASPQVIHERGMIHHPDLVVVADESLVSVPAAGVLHGLDGHTVLLINSHESVATWRNRLNVTGPIMIVPATDRPENSCDLPCAGAVCAGAAARLVGVISRQALIRALDQELAPLGEAIVEQNRLKAGEAYDLMADQTGSVTEGSQIGATCYQQPDWIDLPFEDARVSTPAIHAAATSVEVKTGLWRTWRPVIDHDRCRHCWWVCSTYCPDSAINVTASGAPEIDLDHCKGCMICVAICPVHAIEVIPEHDAQAEAKAEKKP